MPNLVLEAIASTKAKHKPASVTTVVPEIQPKTPNDMNSKHNSRLASSESKKPTKGPTYLHHYPGHDRGRFTAYCNMLAKEGSSSNGDETLSP